MIVFDLMIDVASGVLLEGKPVTRVTDADLP
jgi:hypothetical protein